MLDARPNFCDIAIRESVFEDVKHNVICTITDTMDILYKVNLP